MFCGLRGGTPDCFSNATLNAEAKLAFDAEAIN